MVRSRQSVKRERQDSGHTPSLGWRALGALAEANYEFVRGIDFDKLMGSQSHKHKRKALRGRRAYHKGDWGG